MTRCDFGWWSLQIPGSCLWWMGSDETIGTQPDIWEFGEALSVAWGCPASCSGLDGWKNHPRGADILEVMRRWEDVRWRGLLTPEQVARFRAVKPGHEVTLLVGADGGYVFRDITPLTVADDVEGRRYRAFVFEEGEKAAVAFWCGDRDSRTFLLPSDSHAFVWREEYAGRDLKPERTSEGVRLVASNRQYLFFDADVDTVRTLFAKARPEPPVGVDVVELRRRVKENTAENRRRFDAFNAVYADESRRALDREAARMKMLSVLNDERANLKELREFANEAERAEIAKKLAEILATDKRLCGR